MQDKEIKELIRLIRRQTIASALASIEQWYDQQNTPSVKSGAESMARKHGWRKGVDDVVYILKKQLESVNIDEINNHMLGEIKFDESKGHKVEGFLEAVDILSGKKTDGENGLYERFWRKGEDLLKEMPITKTIEQWEPIGELVKNETPEVVCVGETLRYPIDLTAFRWGCPIPTSTTKRLEIDPHC